MTDWKITIFLIDRSPILSYFYVPCSIALLVILTSDLLKMMHGVFSHGWIYHGNLHGFLLTPQATMWQATGMVSTCPSSHARSWEKIIPGLKVLRTGWWFGCHFWHFPRNIGLLSSSQLTNSNLFQGSNHQAESVFKMCQTSRYCLSPCCRFCGSFCLLFTQAFIPENKNAVLMVILPI